MSAGTPLDGPDDPQSQVAALTAMLGEAYEAETKEAKKR
jgi:hypothetical protein